MPREATQELNLELDAIWEEPGPRPPTAPRPARSQAKRGKNAAPKHPNRDRLQRMVDFAQWERVAMTRFGVATPPADASTADLGLPSVTELLRELRTAEDGAAGSERLLRVYVQMVDMLERNREALDEAVVALGRQLGIGKPQRQ